MTEAPHRILINNTGEAINFLRNIVTLNPSIISHDTETYGLMFNDGYFSQQVTYFDDDMGKLVTGYINCKVYPDEDVNECVQISELTEVLTELFALSGTVFVYANPKFDMHKIKNSHRTVEFKGTIWDIQLTERLIYNLDPSYSLANIAKKYGFEKDGRVEEYIKEHRLKSKVKVLGKETEEEVHHYDRVPLSIMYAYGCTDTEIAYQIYLKQLEIVKERNMMDIVMENCQLNKTVFKMEQKGVRVNVPYIHEQIAIIESKIQEFKANFKDMTTHDYENSAAAIEKVMLEQGIELPKTMAGNTKTDHATLEGCNNAVASQILLIREYEKRLGTFYGILRYQIDGVVHCSFRLANTKTLRLSCTEPNLQNMESDEEGVDDSIRAAFIPREGKAFVSIDYKAMEYCLAADIALEYGWVEGIMKGEDPHMWVANIMGVARTPAKTINFLNLYGGGLAALTMKLFAKETYHSQQSLQAIYMVKFLKNCPFTKPEQVEAVNRMNQKQIDDGLEILRRTKVLKDKYTSALPAVSRFIKDAQSIALKRGFLRNNLGARFHCPDEITKSKIVNHLIQGTGACIVRVAMNLTDDFCSATDYGLDLLIQVHDELLFEVDIDKLEVCNELVVLMESIYKPHAGMILRCDAEYSLSSWNANTFKKLGEE